MNRDGFLLARPFFWHSEQVGNLGIKNDDDNNDDEEGAVVSAFPAMLRERACGHFH